MDMDLTEEALTDKGSAMVVPLPIWQRILINIKLEVYVNECNIICIDCFFNNPCLAQTQTSQTLKTWLC